MLLGLVAIYLKEMNVDPEVLFLASSIVSEDIYLPDAATMTRLRIVNMHDEAEFGGWVIEPYRDGAIVTGNYTDPQNQETQITLFCRRNRPGKVFVLGSWAYLTPARNKADQETAAVRSAVSSTRFEIGNSVIREEAGVQGLSDLHVDNAGRFYLAYALSLQEYEQGLQAGFSIQADVPHSYGYMFRITPPINGLRIRTSIAFKSCI